MTGVCGWLGNMLGCKRVKPAARFQHLVIAGCFLRFTTDSLGIPYMLTDKCVEETKDVF